MTPEDPSSTPTLNLLAPLEQLLHRAVDAGGHLAAGLLAALLVARLMREQRLHWSWALVGLALVLIARPLFAGTATVLEVGAAGAALLGRRWQREDRESGRDLAQMEGGRSVCSPPSCAWPPCAGARIAPTPARGSAAMR